MTKLRIILLSLLYVFCLNLPAQESSYMFRVYLKDKGNTEFNINAPLDFLSQRAIDRRSKQNIAVDESDLPISNEYLTALKSLGCEITAKSKWLNTVAVVCNDSSLVNQIKGLDFVSDAAIVWKGVIGKELKTPPPAKDSKKKVESIEKSGIYGAAAKQILIHRADTLHDMGYKGEGMQIAIIDGGFNGIDQDPLLLSTTIIKEIKDFVYKGASVYQSTDHGTRVLSCMGANASNTFVGTAPKASFWLLRSEDPRSEFPIEEDYWAAAAEYADSIGVDLINSSLGYSWFDAPCNGFTYEQMNGETAQITKAADMAMSKGIFVVTSAGNEGDKTWKHITAAGDAKQAFTVGAIANDSTLAAFSSRGPTADGRIKPDAMSVGKNTSVILANGSITQSNGTSFSSPVLCGVIACLWQANPHLTNMEIADIVRQSSDRYANPDNNFGYGIPSIPRALKIIEQMTGIKQENLPDSNLRIITNRFNDSITISKEDDNDDPCIVKIYSIEGKIVLQESFTTKEGSFKLDKNNYSKVYIVNILYKDYNIKRKICL